MVDITDKSRSFLIAFIGRHVEREELKGLEDEGMAEMLMVRDKIDELKESVQASGPKDTMSTVAQPDKIPERAAQLLEQERLQKELEAVTSTLKCSLQQNPDADQVSVQMRGNSINQGQALVQQQLPQGRCSVQWSTV